MPTLGYKIGLFNSMESINKCGLYPYNSERIRWGIKSYPALITLEIPNDAMVSNPQIRLDIRSNIYNPNNYAVLDSYFIRTIYDAPIKPFDDDLLKSGFIELCSHEPFDLDFEFAISGFKCRCNKAKVVKVELLEEDGYITSAFTNYHRRTNHDEYFYYKRGETVYPEWFDPDLTTVCSNGIHYFEDPRLAILYAFDFYPEFAYNISNNSEYVCHKYFDIVNKED